MIELHIALGKFLQKRECNIYHDKKTTKKKLGLLKYAGDG